jgi:hypothetical protein
VTLLDASVRALLIAAAVALLLKVLRVRTGAGRHAAWTAVTIAMLVMPIVPGWLPSFTLRWPSAIESLPAAVERPAPATLTAAGVPRQQPAASRPPVRADSTPTAPTASGPSTPPATVSAGALLPVVYATGSIVLLVRLAVGWAAAIVLVRRSRPAGGPFLESARVAAPVTAGVLRPRIVLPLSWRSWPADKLNAVLAHEQAHLRRRDTLVAVLAHLNVCVFWFHPLAWWLRRQLNAAAEQSCDEAALRSVRLPRRYAEVLIELAGDVRARGRRTAAAIPMAGGPRLSKRIDDVLAPAPRRLTLATRTTLAIGCCIAIAAGIACRPQPAPLKPDPRVAARYAGDRAEQEALEAARNLAPAEVERLRDRWTANRADIATLKTLLQHYGPDVSGAKQTDAEERIAARRPLILWLIEHRPEDPLVNTIEARIFATGRDWLPDREGFDAARQLWRAHGERPDVDSRVLHNGAYWLDVDDKPLAEQLLLTGLARANDPEWSRRLGRLYAQTIVGSNGFTLFNVVRSSSPDDAASPFARQVREKLDRSRDAALLAAAGSYLEFNARYTKPGFDPQALGKSLLDRAAAIDPNQPAARLALERIERRARHDRLYSALRGRPQDQWPALVAAMPEADRLELLPELAESEYMGAEYVEYANKDSAGAQIKFERSKQYANDALALAGAHKDSAAGRAALYRGRVALALHALREGNRRRSVALMAESVSLPGSATIGQPLNGLAPRLTNYLLKEGERESVIQFLERSADLRPHDRQSLLDSAAAIRKGMMPLSYQATFARDTLE